MRPTRRRWLGATAALLAAGCARTPGPGDAGEAPGRDEAPGPPGHRVPGEFEGASAIWMSYGPGHDSLVAGLVAALAPHVPIKFLLPDAASETALKALLQQRRVSLPQPQPPMQIEPLASFFMRDLAVFTLGPGGERGVLDLAWTQYGVPAWCRRRHGDTPEGRDCATRLDLSREASDRAIARHAGAVLHRSAVALEGGGVESNGAGLLIANEALVQSRNPGRSRVGLDAALRRWPGVQRVIWLPAGLAEDPLLRATITGDFVAWGTGGHTDEFVRFADARTVLLAWPADADAAAHPVARLTRERMAINEVLLLRERTLQGEPLRVLRVPMPRPIERRVFVSAVADPGQPLQWHTDYFAPSERRWAGQPLLQMAVASPLNFVLAPGVVVLPDYRGHGMTAARHDALKRVMEQAFPQRELKFVDAISANWVGGGMHCATLTEP